MKSAFALLLMSGTMGQQDAPIRVSVTLVQVDAVVTGRDGKQVRDLTKDDFEVFEDGKPRSLRHVSYVPSGSRPVPAVKTGLSASEAPPRLERSEVGRSFALVADDLGMSFQGVNYAKQALHRFVDSQMQPGDLVAVISTSGGVSGLQPFTADKRQLHAAINRLRYLLWAGGGNGVLSPIGVPGEDDADVNSVRRRRFNMGTMGAIRYIARGMRSLPGRRSIILFSEGIQVWRGGDHDPSVTPGEILQVADEANRSAVVVYGMDVRGVVYPGLQAMDMVGDQDPGATREALNDRDVKFLNSQQGLAFLARETGGNAFLNDNDLGAGLARVLEDQSGYYLLGYGRPEEDAGKRNRLVVRLKRPGLRLRFRHGAVGETDVESEHPVTVKERLFSALSSPFQSGGFPFRLAPSFALGEKKQLELKALLYFDGAQLSFGAPDPAGMRTAKVHLLAVAEDEAGAPGAATARTYTVRTKSPGQGGFVYALRHEVKKPGLYQLRVAVLDEGSGRVGSASRLVEVPDLSKGGVAVSGINMLTGDWRSRLRDGKAEDAEEDLSAAARVFRRGEPFSYGLMVYNTRPGLAIEPKLVSAGEVVWEGKRMPVSDGGGRGLAGGVLTLGDKTSPGEYQLEVRVVGNDGKPLGAAQWVDFELR